MSVDTVKSPGATKKKHRLLVVSRTWGWVGMGWEGGRGCVPNPPQFYLKVCEVLNVIRRFLWIKGTLVVMMQYFHLGVQNQHS